MARLPQPGSDKGTWGDVLNDYLSQAHNADGTLKDLSQSKITNLTTDLANKVPLAQKAAANGVASLDGSAKVPDAQLPSRLASSELNATFTPRRVHLIAGLGQSNMSGRGADYTTFKDPVSPRI